MTNVGRMINIYRRTPLHPRATRRLMRALARYQQLLGQGDRVVSMPEGFRVLCHAGDFIEAKVLYERCYEPETVAALHRLVKPGDVCLDVGAHVGIIALTLASLGGRVHAIEASDVTFERLQANLALNPEFRVEATRAAVGSVDVDEIELVMPRSYRLDGQVTAAAQRLPQITLDTYVEQHGVGRVAFVKSDTDGMEPDVFAGATRMLERDRPTLLFEMHPNWLREKGSSPAALLDQIASSGYRFFSETLDPLPEPVATAEGVPKGLSANLIAVAVP